MEQYAIRYAIQLENGEYMRTDFYPNIETIKIFAETDILKADLHSNRDRLEGEINNIVSGNTNLPVFYDDDNPPARVVKFRLTYEQVE